MCSKPKTCHPVSAANSSTGLNVYFRHNIFTQHKNPDQYSICKVEFESTQDKIETFRERVSPDLRDQEIFAIFKHVSFQFGQFGLEHNWCISRVNIIIPYVLDIAVGRKEVQCSLLFSWQQYCKMYDIL